MSKTICLEEKKKNENEKYIFLLFLFKNFVQPPERWEGRGEAESPEEAEGPGEAGAAREAAAPRRL